MHLPDPDLAINLRNHAAWQRVAAEYAGDSVQEDDPRLREFVRNQFCLRLRGPRVLEVGCGPGTDAAKLADCGLMITATDFSQRFIAIARRRFPELDLRVMDMAAPNLPSESFDGIYGFGAFIHLPRLLAIQTLAKMYELLAPGGLLFLQLIKSTKGLKEYMIESWAGDPHASMHFTCFEENEVRGYFEATGFREIKFLQLPRSAVYEMLPRLTERGIVGYLACAYR